MTYSSGCLRNVLIKELKKPNLRLWLFFSSLSGVAIITIDKYSSVTVITVIQMTLSYLLIFTWQICFKVIRILTINFKLSSNTTTGKYDSRKKTPKTKHYHVSFVINFNALLQFGEDCQWLMPPNVGDSNVTLWCLEVNCLHVDAGHCAQLFCRDSGISSADYPTSEVEVDKTLRHCVNNRKSNWIPGSSVSNNVFYKWDGAI